MNRSQQRPTMILSAATVTAVVCALGLRWMEGASVAQAASQPPSVTRAADGHYWAEARVQGRSMRMLVDTGASVVTLGRADAERAGVLVESSDFTKEVKTANGSIRAAPVVLASLVVDGVQLNAVDAMVIDADLPAPLLGMSYLGRLSSFEARPEGLTFRG